MSKVDNAHETKRICKNCKAEKHICDYYINRKIPMLTCKQCVIDKQKERRAAGLIDKEKQNESSRASYIRNREKVATRTSKYRLENLDLYKKSSKKYREANKETVNKKAAEYHANRLKTDKDYKLLSQLRNRIRKAVKLDLKADRTAALAGCPISELRAHLESMFAPGMSWDNHGTHGWHIDHIKPCASFNMADPVQQRACFHYTNLQPLWASDNLKKGAS